MSRKMCAYCGNRVATDREHVFPRNLYPESKATSKVQRLRIPSCNVCNNGWSDDEAHFRNVLVVAGEEPNDSRQELWDSTVQRSFQKVDGPRRLQDIVHIFQQVEVDGQPRYKIYPGQDERVVRVVKKVVRGLSHYHNVQSAVPESRVWVDVMKYAVPNEFLAEMICAHRERDIAEYRYSIIEDVGIQSAWLITFFEKVTFIGTVSSAEETHPERLADTGLERTAEKRGRSTVALGQMKERMETPEEKVARVVQEDVAVMPYDPRWPEMFQEEKAHLLSCLPDALINRIEHFGSTAVSGVAAKPIVDMLVEVTSLDETREIIPPILEAQGYDYFWRPTWGDDTPPYYAWFIKRDREGNRTHHIHMVEAHFEHWDRLLFRDYLIEHPEVAQEYAALKMGVSETHRNDRVAYTKAKTEFVVRVTDTAKAYYGKGQPCSKS